jgi:hypothetical protein
VARNWSNHLGIFTNLRSRLWHLSIPLLLLSAACAQTTVRPIVRTAERNLQRPERILLYDFATTAAKINEYQGIMRQQPAHENPVARQRELGKIASSALTTDVALWLRQRGFTVERVPHGVSVEPTDLIINGQIVNIDEGNPLRRLLIGFGAGASTMTTRVQIFTAGGRQKVLEFATNADSGTLPGAAATVPVSAAMPIGVSLGLSAGGVVAAGLNGNSSAVGRMAAASADQAIRYLSEFFAKQGWIPENQVRPARVVR